MSCAGSFRGSPLGHTLMIGMSRQRSFSSAASAPQWMEGAQWGMQTEDVADKDAWFERLHSQVTARAPPRRVSSVLQTPDCACQLSLRPSF